MPHSILSLVVSCKGVILICLCLAFAPLAQAQNAPDSEVMAQQPLPDHESDATLDGKTALEHADALSGGNARQSREALQALARMGVDALPAREIVRAFAENPDGGVENHADGGALKVAALSVLAAMRAPEIHALLRQKLMDPDYLTRDQDYETLLVATGQLGLDHDILARDMIFLTQAAPDHAQRLMVINALEDPVQSVLNEAVFGLEHDEAATRHFLANLASLDFLSASEKLDFVAAHRDLAAEEGRLMQEALARVGTPAALDLALQLDSENEVDPHRTFRQFADGLIAKEEITERVVALAQTRTAERDISLVMSRLETMLGDESDDAFTTSMRESHQQLFVAAMGALIIDGPDDAHRAVGIQQQVRFLQRHDDVPLEAALDPIFDLLETPTSASIHNAAARALTQSPARIASSDPDYFIERTLSILWKAHSPELAEFPVSLLSALMRSPDHAGLVVDKIAAQIDPHLGDWATNAATAVATTAGTIQSLEFTPVRETAGEVMGKALASPALDLDYLGPHMARGGGAIAVLDGNTVEGVVAVFTPTIFAQEKPGHYPFPLESFLQPMLGRPAWLQRDPDARNRWIAFLQEVAALDDTDFSPYAREALEAFQ